VGKEKTQLGKAVPGCVLVGVLFPEDKMEKPDAGKEQTI